MIVTDIESPPSETPELTLKPVPVSSQLWMVAAIEVIFQASKYSSWLATGAWIATMAGFFIFDDWNRNWFIFGPVIAAVAVGFGWTILYVAVLAPFRYNQISEMATRMEYRFYADRFVYTVGDEKWRSVSYEKLKEVELRKTNKRDMGHLRLYFDTQEKINFASRKIPNIIHAESARNDIMRLLDQYRTTSRRAG